jgi:cytidylate kinase
VAKDTQIVTIDGHRGTGKSVLARNLRQSLDCGVLEIGPIFRLIAWIIYAGHAVDPQGACDFVCRGLETGLISIDTQANGEISACRIEIDQKLAEKELWSPVLDTTLRNVAESSAGAECVRKIASILVGETPIIIVGREVGNKFFPEAGVKIVLEASGASRKERKLSQLKTNLQETGQDYELESSEPKRDWQVFDASLVIDTSDLTEQHVLDKAISHIVERLRWQGKKQS